MILKVFWKCISESFLGKIVNVFVAISGYPLDCNTKVLANGKFR
jgi:hypothetical protein